MKQKIMLAAACIALVGTIGWAVSRAMSLKPDESVNNGYNMEMAMPSPDLRKKMEEAWKSAKPEDFKKMREPGQMGQMQEQFIGKLPDAEQVEMRNMMRQMQQQREQVQAVLSPEEERVMMQKFMGLMRSGRGPFGRRGSDGENRTEPEKK